MFCLTGENGVIVGGVDVHCDLREEVMTAVFSGLEHVVIS